MAMADVGARLDRLPISRFHYKILWLIGLGMFFDTFDINLTGGVLAGMAQEGFSNVVYMIITIVFLVTAVCVMAWGIETRKKSLEEIGNVN